MSLFKDTALASTIGLSELLFAGRLLASQNYQYLQLFTIVFVFYLVISYPAMLGVRWLEKHTSLQRKRPRRRALIADFVLGVWDRSTPSTTGCPLVRGCPLAS